MMEMAIMKTDISTGEEFRRVRNRLLRIYSIRECTIDLEDVDKVVRVVGDEIKTKTVVNKIKSYGYLCEELPD